MKARWIIGLIAVAAFGIGRMSTPEPAKPTTTTSSAGPVAVVASPSLPPASPNLPVTPAPVRPDSATQLQSAAPKGPVLPPTATTPALVPIAPPAPRPPASPAPTITVPEIAYVRGDRVALRGAPNAEGQILDRLNSGQVVHRLVRQGEWSRVRHGLTQQEGWISERRLSAQPPQPKPATETATMPETKTVNPSATLATTVIITLLIQESVSAYRASRPCACPYNQTRTGRSCGGNSAWSRAGGAKPLCYPADVTPAMVAAFRGRSR